MSSRSLARVQVLLAAAIFSTGGAAIKAVGLTSWQIASFRSGIAALVLVLLLREARTGWNRRTALVGLAYAATVLLFVAATRLTTSANAIFLQSTAPLYILLLSPWLLRERITRADLLFMLAVGGGLLLFFLDPEQPRATAPDPATGNLLALASGVSFAGLVMGLRWLGGGARADGGKGAMACVALGNLLAFVIGLPFALAATPPLPATTTDWSLLAFLGVIQISLAYLLLSRGLRHVPAFEASVLLLAEPALNPLWSWLAHGEVPGALAVAGGAIILGATLLKAKLAAGTAAVATAEPDAGPDAEPGAGPGAPPVTTRRG
jgi:drug/metabolite transporter, DME family